MKQIEVSTDLSSLLMIQTHELDGSSQDHITAIALYSDQNYHDHLASPNSNSSSAAGMDISFFCMNSHPTSTLTFTEKETQSASPSYNRPISDLISMSHNIQSKEAPTEKYRSDISSTIDQLTSNSGTISNDFSVISEDETSLHNPILASEIVNQRATKKSSRASSFQPMLSEEDFGHPRSPHDSNLSLRRSSRSITNSDSLKLKMSKKRNSVNPEFTYSTTGKVIEQLTTDPKLQTLLLMPTL